MHDVTEQVERLAMMVLLLLFGGAIVSGLFATIGWIDIVVALVILLVIRPVTGLIGLTGHRADRGEKLTPRLFRYPRRRLDLLSRLPA